MNLALSDVFAGDLGSPQYTAAPCTVILITFRTHARTPVTDTTFPGTSRLLTRPPLETICPLCMAGVYPPRSVSPSCAQHRRGHGVSSPLPLPAPKPLGTCAPAPTLLCHSITPRSPTHPSPQPHTLGNSLVMHTLSCHLLCPAPSCFSPWTQRPAWGTHEPRPYDRGLP